MHKCMQARLVDVQSGNNLLAGGWSNNLKFVGDCIEDITVTCFTCIILGFECHGVANDLNLVGDSEDTTSVLCTVAYNTCNIIRLKGGCTCTTVITDNL